MKLTIASIIVAVALIGGALILKGGNSSSISEPQAASNVTEVDGKQVIDIAVKGGYRPRSTVAKANIPTVLRMKTNSTFDCSLALTIPSVGYRQVLPQTSVTEIQVPAQQPGTTLQGSCSMGMYNFSVKFN